MKTLKEKEAIFLAKELNEVLGLVDENEISIKSTLKEINKGISEAVDLLEAEDVLTEKTIVLLSNAGFDWDGKMKSKKIEKKEVKEVELEDNEEDDIYTKEELLQKEEQEVKVIAKEWSLSDKGKKLVVIDRILEAQEEAIKDEEEQNETTFDYSLEDLQEMEKTKDIKDIAEDFGLRTDGTKTIVISRIMAHQKGELPKNGYAPKSKKKKEEEKEIPVKKEAPKKEEKKTVEKTEKGKSATYIVRKMVCENPKRDIEDIVNEIIKDGIKITLVSAKLRRNEVLAAISIMKELGKLK